MVPRWLLVLVVALLAAGACASDDESAGQTAPSPAASPTPTPSATPSPSPTMSPSSTPTPSATPSPSPTASPSPPASIEVASLNVLHGFFCPPETDWCDAPSRLEILWQHVEAQGCPDVVALQEIAPRQVELTVPRLETLCGGVYEMLVENQGIPDQEMLLTSLDISDDGYVDLAAFPWTAHWAVLEAEMGPVLIVVSHFASSANNPDCTAEICPPELCEAGLEAGSCNALQVIELAEVEGMGTVAQLVVGDLNKPHDDPRIQILSNAGFVDAWLGSGNPECDPATGAGCTCCLDGPEPWVGLDQPSAAFDNRIDFILARGTQECAVTFPAGSAVPFAAEPLEVPVAGLYWPSDHGGVAATISC